MDIIIAGTGVQGIVARTAKDRVIARVPVNGVVPKLTHQGVIDICPHDGVVHCILVVAANENSGGATHLGKDELDDLIWFQINFKGPASIRIKLIMIQQLELALHVAVNRCGPGRSEDRCINMHVAHVPKNLGVIRNKGLRIVFTRGKVSHHAPSIVITKRHCVTGAVSGIISRDKPPGFDLRTDQRL